MTPGLFAATSDNQLWAGHAQIHLQPNESVDMYHPMWLPDGRFALFGLLPKVINGVQHRFGRVWAVTASDGTLSNFEGDTPTHTWFGPDRYVAWIDSNFVSEKPTRLRAGPPDAPADVVGFRRDRLPGMSAREFLAGVDPLGHLLLVALGPEKRIAFTCYIDGDAEEKIDPETGNKHQVGLASSQWVLVTGRCGDKKSLTIVAAESTAIGQLNENRGPRLGLFQQLSFAPDGSLLFTSNGMPTSRMSQFVASGDPWPAYLWNWSEGRLKLLAMASDKIPGNDAPDLKMGRFRCQWYPDGRTLLTGIRNDSAYVVTVR